MTRKSSGKVGDFWSVLPSCRGLCTVKSGRNRSLTQRYYCKACKAYFTPTDAWTRNRREHKSDILYLYFSNHSLRLIGKEFKLHHQTVKNLIDTELRSLKKKVDDLTKRGLSYGEIQSKMVQESPDGFLAKLVRGAKEKEGVTVLQIILEEQTKPMRENALKVISAFRLY